MMILHHSLHFDGVNVGIPGHVSLADVNIGNGWNVPLDYRNFGTDLDNAKVGIGR